MVGCCILLSFIGVSINSLLFATFRPLKKLCIILVVTAFVQLILIITLFLLI